jgi:cob(I)alamin adenosyltransferase
MKLYTGKGDSGQTDLLGDRIGKDDPRIELLGELDEATSAIGLARSLAPDEAIAADLIDIQRDLYRIMAELAFTDELRPERFTFDADRVAWLEAATDQLSTQVELRPEFILPGGSTPSAALDLARTVVRRAERRAVGTSVPAGDDRQRILGYLNRLSSYLFVAARFVEQAAGVKARPART